MNKFFAILVTLAVTLLTTNVFAWDPPPSPAPASWISDPSGVLSAAAHSRLDDKLKEINKSSANEVAALILPSLDGESISDVGVLTAKAWGVGKKDLDNGVLVILAMKEHKSRIETGKGVEGDLPDLKCNDILNNVMRPRMKRGDVEGALAASFDAISTSIANHKTEAAAAKAHQQESNNADNTPPGNNTDNAAGSLDGLWGMLFAICLFVLAIGIITFISRRRRQEEDELRELELENMRSESRKNLNRPTPAVDTPVVRPRPHHASRPKAPSFPEPDYTPPVPVYVPPVEEDSRPSYPSSSSDNDSSTPDWGGGSSGGGSDDSGGFGGGNFGGGGSDGSW